MARILVIDDEEDVRIIVQQVLEGAGHEVLLAPDGAKGMELQRLQPSDLVVTDILMPEKEGMETIRDLRQEYPGLRIIAMSGGGRSVKLGSYLSTASDLGADVILRKPFDAGVLLDAVQHSLALPKR